MSEVSERVSVSDVIERILSEGENVWARERKCVGERDRIR